MNSLSTTCCAAQALPEKPPAKYWKPRRMLLLNSSKSRRSIVMYFPTRPVAATAVGLVEWTYRRIPRPGHSDTGPVLPAAPHSGPLLPAARPEERHQPPEETQAQFLPHERLVLEALHPAPQKLQIHHPLLPSKRFFSACKLTSPSPITLRTSNQQQRSL